MSTALKTVTGNTVRTNNAAGFNAQGYSVTHIEPGSLESRSIEAAIAHSALDFTVDTRPIFIESADSLGGIRQIDGYRSVYRTDHPESDFAVMGSGYTVVQNGAGLNWAQPVLDSGEASIIRAGYTDGGAKTFITAEVRDGRAEVKRGDLIRLLVTFYNSHDGSSCAGVKIGAERLACDNGMCLLEEVVGVKARHTGNVLAALAGARAQLDAARRGLQVIAERSAGLTRRRMNKANLERFIREVLSPGAGSDPEIVVRNVDAVMKAAVSAPGAEPGTLWGAVNGLTYWATHQRGRTDSGRVNANLFGQGQQLIDRAFEVAFASAEHLPMIELARESFSNHATAKAEFDALLGRPANIPSLND